jgi:DNA-binding GntR family transcriptional regulator
VRRTLLKDSAFEGIRQAIVRGDLAPGEAVRDVDLARQLGLSRAPVRDALARLAEDGLIETKPQSYTRVTPLVAADIRDAAAVVRVLHELAARTAIPRLTDGDITTMRDANRRCARAISTADVDEATAADDELHGVLVRVCGNRAVAATIDRYTPLIRRLERRQFSNAACRSVASHDRLIDACVARDPDAAARVTADIWRSLEELADE